MITAVSTVGCVIFGFATFVLASKRAMDKQDKHALWDELTGLSQQLKAEKEYNEYLKNDYKVRELDWMNKLVEEQRIVKELRDELHHVNGKLRAKTKPETIKCDGVSVKLDAKTSMNFSVGKVVKDIELVIKGNTISVIITKHNGDVKTHTFDNACYSYRKSQK